MTRTLYEVLMISPRADRDLITAVYRHLAKRYHPDVDASPEAAARMAEVNEAYAILGDAAKRARYDEQVGLALAETAPLLPGDVRPSRAGAASPAPVESPPYGEAGPPPLSPSPSGNPLSFGRYRGWTLNQVVRVDRDYLEWLARTTMGRTWRTELENLLRR